VQTAAGEGAPYSAEVAALWPQALDISTTEMAMACMGGGFLNLAMRAMRDDQLGTMGGQESSVARSWLLYTFYAGFAERLVFRIPPA
jgi:hypothetical protein